MILKKQTFLQANMKKSMVLLVLFFFSFFAVRGSVALDNSSVAAAATLEVTPVAQDPKILPWWPSRHQEVLERVKTENVDLIMIGDSITHGWEKAGRKIWNQYYTRRNAVNLGFGGDKTQHVLWRLQNGEVEGIRPKLAVLMIGTNNSAGSDADHIAGGIWAIVRELKTRLPGTKILVLGIFPRGSVEQRKGEIHYEEAVYNDQWEKIDQVNELISKFADNQTVYYININNVFINENNALPRENFPDLLHPGEKGYQLWAEAMEPMIKELLTE